MRDEDNSNMLQYHDRVVASSVILALKRGSHGHPTCSTSLNVRLVQKPLACAGRVMFKVEIFLAWPPFWR